MMASGDSSNTVVWVVVIVLAFFGVVLLMVAGGDDGDAKQPQQPQDSNLERLINSQMGSGDPGLADDPVPAPQPPTEE